MKRLFYSAVVITALLMSSCTPDNPTTTNNQTTTICPQPSLQFKGNGILYVCNAVADSRLGWVGFPRLVNQDNPSNNYSGYNLEFTNHKIYSEEGTWSANYPITQNTVDAYIDFGPTVANLTVGNYSNTDMGMGFPNLNYTYETNPNSLNLNITSLTNGLASGTFSGSIPGGTGPLNNGPQMIITDGIFSNIPVIE